MVVKCSCAGGELDESDSSPLLGLTMNILMQFWHSQSKEKKFERFAVDFTEIPGRLKKTLIPSAYSALTLDMQRFFNVEFGKSHASTAECTCRRQARKQVYFSSNNLLVKWNKNNAQAENKLKARPIDQAQKILYSIGISLARYNKLARR